MNKKLKTIDLFAGVGGLKIAFEREGFDIIFSNDIDPSCKITYDLNSDDVKMVCQDINEIPNNAFRKFDVLLGGFPCQPFSIAGHRKGFQDEGRGDLFFKILDILKENKPSAFLLENVKNMVSHEKGETMKYIVEELEKIGYHVTYKVLNTCEYGNLPQNRERVYIVGMKGKKSFDLFKFPEKEELKLKLEDILENEVAEKYYYTPKSLIYDNLKDEVLKFDTAYQWRRIYVRENKNNLCPTLTANMGTGGHNVPLIRDKKGIRKLTPRECARLQGFSDSYKFPTIADSKLYKQFGNSISIPVIQKIAKSFYLALNI